MTEKELQTYLQERFPCENEACDWKEFKSLKNCFNSKEGDDVIYLCSCHIKYERRSSCHRSCGS